MDFISYSTNENKTLFPFNWIQSSIVRKFIALWGSSDLCPVENNHTYIFHLCYEFNFQWKWGGGSRNNHWCISHLPLNNRLLWHTDKKHGLDSFPLSYTTYRSWPWTRGLLFFAGPTMPFEVQEIPKSMRSKTQWPHFQSTVLDANPVKSRMSRARLESSLAWTPTYPHLPTTDPFRKLCKKIIRKKKSLAG